MIILNKPVPFSQLSYSLSGSVKWLLSSSKWQSAALPHSWLSSHLWMDLHQSANLEWNHYRGCDPWNIDQDWKIERWEALYVYTHIRVAHLLFRSFEHSHCHQVGQVVFRASVAPVMVEVHLCLCASSVSVDSLLCHIRKEDCCLCDFHEPLPAVFLSQLSHCYAWQPQHPASSLLGLRRQVSWSAVAFPLSRHAKTLL